MRKMVERIRFCLFFMMIVVVMTSCGGFEQKIGLLSYNLSDPFIDDFARKIVDSMGDEYAVRSLDAENSQMLQNEQIDALIDEGVDLMIINPVDRLSVFAVIRKLKKNNIPVIFFNREPLQEDLQIWNKTYYVGAMAEQSAQLQVELVTELFGGDPERLNSRDRNGDNRIQAVILKGEQGHQDAEIRTTEVLKTFHSSGFDIDLLHTEVANWSEQEAFESMREILNEFGSEIEVILSNNDAMANGAITLLKARGWFQDSNQDGHIDSADADWIPVLGIDGIAKAVTNIEEGLLYGSVLNDSDSQAHAIVELAEAILKGTDLEKLSFPLKAGQYIWIDYQTFSSRTE